MLRPLQTVERSRCAELDIAVQANMLPRNRLYSRDGFWDLVSMREMRLERRDILRLAVLGDIHTLP